jgi:hypothetical protein
MKTQKSATGPIQFTKAELGEARKGNYEPIEKRIQKELPKRAYLVKRLGRPRTKAEIAQLIRQAGPQS